MLRALSLALDAFSRLPPAPVLRCRATAADQLGARGSRTMPRGGATRGRGGRGRGRGGSAAASRRAASGIDDDDDDELDDDIGDADFKPKHVSKKRGGGGAGSVTGRARDKTRKSAPRVGQRLLWLFVHGCNADAGLCVYLPHRSSRSCLLCMTRFLLCDLPGHGRHCTRSVARARVGLILTSQLINGSANDERELAAQLKHLGLYAANT